MERESIISIVVGAVVLIFIMLMVFIPKGEKKDSPEEETVYYEVIYEANGGQMATSSVQKMAEGIAQKLPTPIKEGFEFVGWYDNPNFKGNPFDETVLVENDTKLYAKFVKLMKINYHIQGGSANNPEFVREDETLVLKDALSAEGAFEGWYSDPKHTSRVTEIVCPKESVDLYAKYLAAYHIKYNNIGEGVNNSANPTYFLEGAGAQLFAPTRNGYTFTGWEDENGNSITSIPAGTLKNVTVYATWEPTSYRVIWNLNGGSTDNKLPESYKCGVGLTNFIIPVNEGKIFVGWYRTFDGEEILCDNISVTDYGDITLKAKWFDNPLRVSSNMWEMDYMTDYLIQDKSGNASNVSDAITIYIPEELKRYADLGVLGVNISATFTVKVQSAGNATATVDAFLKINGEETLVCSQSAKGDGYIFSSPRRGSKKTNTSTVTKSVEFKDMQNIKIGYRYYMSSNKKNDDVATGAYYICDNLTYNFYVKR